MTSTIQPEHVAVDHRRLRSASSSNGYALRELLRAGIAQLNSTGPTASRPKRASSTRITSARRTRCSVAASRSSSVCIDPTSVGRHHDLHHRQRLRSFFGPDNSRQANAFDTWSWRLAPRHASRRRPRGAAAGRVLVGDVFNLFLQHSAGAYYFDSLADFQNRTRQFAARTPTRSRSTPTMRPPTSCMTSGRSVQDDWRISDQLTFTYGVRYDLYGDELAGARATPIFQARTASQHQDLQGSGHLPAAHRASTEADRRLRCAAASACSAAVRPTSICRTASRTPASSPTRSASPRAAAANGSGTHAAPFNVHDAADVGDGGAERRHRHDDPAAVDGVSADQRRRPTHGADHAAGDPTSGCRRCKATLSADYDLFGASISAPTIIYSDAIQQRACFTDLRSVASGTLPDGRPRYTLRPTPA